MEDFAVAEAPGMDTAVDSAPETETGLAPDVETGETTGVEEPTTEVEAPETPKDFKAVENGRLHPLLKSHIEETKAKNPALARTIQKALFAEDRLRRELPNGFKDLADLRGKIEELGGDQGIQEVRQEIDGWREFDSKWTAGDPEVIKFLTETPEAQAAFIKIAPAAFEKYREAHPEGYSAYVSQVFEATMNESQIPILLEKLAWIGKDNPEILDLQQRLMGFVRGVSALARKQVAPPKVESSGPDPRASELDQREQQLTRQEWTRESGSIHGSLFNQQWKALIGDRKLTDTQIATVKELYGLKLAAILKAKPDFNQNLNRYFGAKQKDGFMKLYKSVYSEAVPRALRTAMEQVGIGKPGPKPGQTPAKPEAAPTKPAAAGVNTGFTFTAAKPDMVMVNRSLTTPEMWQKGQAILKTGSKVWWKK